MAAMTSDTNPNRGTRWRIVRDVAEFQIKCALEAVLDLTLIPLSLAAAAVDLVVGNWRRPRLFHAVLRFGERCEDWINLWGVAPSVMDEGRPGVDAVMHNIEAVILDPRTGPQAVRTLRRWAAMKLAGGSEDGPRRADRDDDAST
jgi:hypothetical protein